jgi:hypothetical protein
MLSGATASALAMAGTAVLRIVVSSDSIKKATATSQGNKRFTASPGAAMGAEAELDLPRLILPPFSLEMNSSFIDVFAMSNRNDKDKKQAVLNRAKDAVVAHAISP